QVDEATVEDTIAILRGLKERYEVHHGVDITDPAIVAAATLSHRYIADRQLPDKAIDLIDEAGSQIRMEMDSKPEVMDKLDRRLIQLKIERVALKKESDKASKNRLKILQTEISELEKEYSDLGYSPIVTSSKPSRKVRKSKRKAIKSGSGSFNGTPTTKSNRSTRKKLQNTIVALYAAFEGYIRNIKELDFKRVYTAAKDDYDENGGEFVDIFAGKYDEIIKDDKMVKLFAIADIDELGIKSTNQDVVDFLSSQEAKAMDGVEEIMNRRINQFGVAQPNIQKDPANNRLYIELPGVMDEKTVAEKLKSTANLQFFETYRFGVDFDAQWEAIVTTAAQPERIEAEIVAVVDSSDTNSLAGDVIPGPSDPDSADTGKQDIQELTSLSGSSLDNTSEDGNQGLRELVLRIDETRLFVRSEDRGQVEKLLNRKDVINVFNDNLKLMWGASMEKLNDEIGLGYFLYPCKVPESGKALVGGKDIKDYQEKAEFVEITSAGLKESHVHDVIITHEAPNYRIN
ncbi:MAG: hypothetical protein L3J44_05555, partial [Campylobacteraceae bacterium]|nr:hypothetical protein [Campylobacteraceae bacterium]